MCAWSVPRDWTAGEVVSEAMMDVHVRDNLAYLKAVLDGTATQDVSLLGNVGIGVAASTRALQVHSASPDDQIYVSSSGPNIVLGDHATFASATMTGMVALATSAGQYSLGAGDLMVATSGASRGHIQINANYSGAGTKHVYLQPTSGQVYLANGSAGVPALAFASDPDTGIWRSGANQIEFSVGGSSAFTVSSTILYAMQPLLIASTGATALALNRFSSDGVLVEFMRDSGLVGTISVAGGAVAYNPFMGAHYTQLATGQDEPPAGAVVVATGDLLDGERAAYSRIEWTETPADPRVYGVWIGEVVEGAGGHDVGDPDLPISNVAGLGLHWCWVTDSGGDLAPGDLLETSAQRWHAQRQQDGMIRNSTLGKYIGPPIDWATVPGAAGLKSARAPCVLYCG